MTTTGIVPLREPFAKPESVSSNNSRATCRADFGISVVGIGLGVRDVDGVVGPTGFAAYFAYTAFGLAIGALFCATWYDA
jgi:hypothetical protein